MIKKLYFTKNLSGLLLEESLRNVHMELGFQLPQVFLEFCRLYNGGHPMIQNSFYPVPQVCREFHKEYGLKSRGVTVDGLFGISEAIRSYDAVAEYRQIRELSRIPLFPISFDLFGNQAVILGSDPNGKVYWRDHELWKDDDLPNIFYIADSLEQFYNGLVRNPYEEEWASP